MKVYSICSLVHKYLRQYKLMLYISRIEFQLTSLYNKATNFN